jgi:adenosylcobinamide-phosphate synthase
MWLPHPVRIIGRAITYMENLLRAILQRVFVKTHTSPFGKQGERAAGILLVAVIVIPSALIAFFIIVLLQQASSGFLLILSEAVLIYLIGTTIALRELVSSAKQVIDSIKAGMIEDARKHLSMIVGRDTAELTEDCMLRATIETLAENLSDGVIAPIFYLLIGGLPMAIAYKAINTLDSMVGYKNEKYMRLGWAAARLDDIANFIPARLSGIFIVIASFFAGCSLTTARSSFKIMRRDGRKHASPNSGIPEAAMAGALGVRLGGPSSYSGRPVEKPYIGNEDTGDYFAAAQKALALVATASVLSVTAAAAVLGLRTIMWSGI